MSTDSFELFFALLTLAANAGALVLLAGHVIVRVAPASALASRAAGLIDGLGASALALAWVVALTATLGSLYFSEIADFTPCTLCWYQRIAMYPLAVVLAVAALRSDRGVRRYVWPIIAIGGVISTYHYLLEWFPEIDTGTCSLTIPCDFVWFRQFGFVTLSYMALSGFLLIGVLLLDPGPRPASEEL